MRIINAEALVERRLEVGLTQWELAQRSGIQPTTISHIERGASRGSLETITRLADALGCSVDSLLTHAPEAVA